MALAQSTPTSPAPAITPPAAGDPPAGSPAAPPQPPGGSAPPAAQPQPASTSAPASGTKPTSAQQAVLDRIRRLRDGDQRRFGNCSYRWDRWKLQPDGSRTTSYSCEGSPPIVNHTIGVNCSKLQINSFNPSAEHSDTAQRGSWGSWRLPAAGGEEQMVATLCANALPLPAGAPAAATPAPQNGAAKTGSR
jgi:hypothetical protein